MRIPPRRAVALAPAFWLGLVLTLNLACATPFGPGGGYDYFTAPGAHDPWSPKISGWQARERALAQAETLGAPASVSGSGEPAEQVSGPPATDLRAKFQSYRAEQRREQARDLSEWIQAQAKEHYVSDGPIDHWATLEGTLSRNGDDCDGLELIVYHMLLELGFDPAEVFRAIVYRPSDGQHHMVTLWFERRDDPWVIDPTGAMTSRMVRMSEAAGWVPLKVFGETSEYTVERRRSAAPRIEVTQR